MGGALLAGALLGLAIWSALGDAGPAAPDVAVATVPADAASTRDPGAPATQAAPTPRRAAPAPAPSAPEPLDNTDLLAELDGRGEAPQVAQAQVTLRGATERARIQRVIDGDTVVLGDGRRVRLIGINTPETGEPLFRESTEALRDLIDGREVLLEYDAERKDQFDRVLAYIHRDDLFVNGELVRQGLAYCYTWPPNTAHVEELVALQRSARADSLGLWALPAPPPAALYVANRRTPRFHREGCRWIERVTPRNRVVFQSRDEAFDEGHNPCDTCDS